MYEPLLTPFDTPRVSTSWRPACDFGQDLDGPRCPRQSVQSREPPPRSDQPEPPLHERLSAMLREAWRRHRSRVQLAELDARMLKDIGITYAEAEREVNKPFWLP